MGKVAQKLKENFAFWALSGFFLIELLNPVFKKYDYGAGWPMVIVLAVLTLPLALGECKREREPARLENFFLLVFAGAVLVSFHYSQTRNMGFSEVLAFLACGLVYLILAYSRNSWMSSFLKIVRMGALLAALLGFYFYLTEGELRMAGPFFNILHHSNVWPNAFGLFLLMAWPLFLLDDGDIPRGPWRKSGKILAISILLAALLLTFSRGAVIVLVGQLVILAAYFARGLRKSALFGIVALVVLVAGLFFAANALRSFKHEVIDVEERATFGNGESLTSKQERVDFWLGAIELIKEKPWFGWGPFSFRQAYNPIQKTFLGNADHPHNIFLKIGAENGLIALGAFLAFVITILVTVARRFSSLDLRDRGVVFILSISVAGAFAHNLIDYNFNFVVNLLLLFLFLAFIRSIVVDRKELLPVKFWLPLFLALWIFVVAIDEGVLLTLSRIKNEDFLANSRYPRNYYLSEADSAIAGKNYAVALEFLGEQERLNKLDAQTYYLRGVVYCSKDNLNGDLLICVDNFKKALELSPLNDLAYYRDYFRALEQLPGKNENPDLADLRDKSLLLLGKYFGYVESNVHFTAYTVNVEAAAELVEMLIPYLENVRADKLLRGREEMLETAMRLRAEKEY